MSNPEDALLALLAPEHREGVLEGRLEALPGQNPQKPVVRDAKTKQLMPGSGRYPKANDVAAVSKATAYKRTKNYQEAMSLLMDVDAGPEVRGSFAWWYEQAMEAAEGSPVRLKIECQHQGCTEKEHGVVALAGKKDGQLIFKLLELKHGKAKETVEVSMQEAQFERMMEARTKPVALFTVDPHDAEARKAALLESGVIEAEWFEVDE